MTVSVGNIGVAQGTGNINISVLSSDDTRKYARITNLVANPTFLSIGTSALENNGILLNVKGDYYEINKTSNFTTEFIRAQGSGNIVSLSYQTY